MVPEGKICLGYSTAVCCFTWKTSQKHERSTKCWAVASCVNYSAEVHSVALWHTESSSQWQRKRRCLGVCDVSVAWLPARIGSVWAHTLPSLSFSLLYYVCWQANTFSLQVVQIPMPHLHLIQTHKVSFGVHVCFTAIKCFIWRAMMSFPTERSRWIWNCTLLKLRHKHTDCFIV